MIEIFLKRLNKFGKVYMVLVFLKGKYVIRFIVML